MAKKAAAATTDQQPEISKSDAIRAVYSQLPDAAASTVVSTVQKEYGLEVSTPLVYQVKAKLGGGSSPANTGNRRVRKPGKAAGGSQSVVETIEAGRRLLSLTGSIEDATAVLRAL